MKPPREGQSGQNHLLKNKIRTSLLTPESYQRLKLFALLLPGLKFAGASRCRFDLGVCPGMPETVFQATILIYHKLSVKASATI